MSFIAGLSTLVVALSGFSDNEWMDGRTDRRHKHGLDGLVASLSNLSILLLLQFSLPDLALQNPPVSFRFFFLQGGRPWSLPLILDSIRGRTLSVACILSPRPTR
jgi:hypothetical protein